MKRLFLLLAILLVGGLIAQAQEQALDPARGPEDTIVNVSLDNANERCSLHREESAFSSGLTLQPIEFIDDLTYQARIPTGLEVGYTYFVYCGFGGEFSSLSGTFTVTSNAPLITGSQGQIPQPEDYFQNVQNNVPGSGQISPIRQVGNDWVVDIDFQNQVSQVLRVQARGSDRNQVLTYANNVQITNFVAAQLNTNSFSLNPDRQTGQAPGRSNIPADVRVDLTLLSSGIVNGGQGDYIIYFRLDPPLERSEIHDYLLYDQLFAAARATDDVGKARLTMWRTGPGDPYYANSDTTAGDGQTIFLKHDGGTTRGNYAARVTNEVSGRLNYDLDGTFGERTCPPQDDGCPALPTDTTRINTLSFANVDHPDMDCGARRGLLNVRTGPGVEYGIVSRLMVCDPIAIVGRAQASNGRWWVRLVGDTDQWINVAYTDFNGDINSIPLSSDYSFTNTAPEITVGSTVTGNVTTEYGVTHFFESTTGSYNIEIDANAPGMVHVVVGGTHFDSYPFGRGENNIPLVTNNTTTQHSLIIRYNGGATGRYTLTVNQR